MRRKNPEVHDGMLCESSHISKDEFFTYAEFQEISADKLREARNCTMERK
jgi:hypothetical protein